MRNNKQEVQELEIKVWFIVIKVKSMPAWGLVLVLALVGWALYLWS